MPARHLALFAARRADIECFARDLEARGRARATVTRRLCTIAGFYRYAVEEELLDHSPAVHVRRPRLDYESHAVALDRNELGALLVAAGLGPSCEHALISLLALNGLRVSEATGADIEHLGLERGHRTLMITRKGGKVVTIPLAPRTARAIDLAVGERTRRAGVPWRGRPAAGPARRRADRPPDRPPRRDRQARQPHTCGTRSSPPRWTPGSRCGTSRKPPRMPTRGPPCATTGPAASLDRHATYIVAAYVAGPPGNSTRREHAPPGGGSRGAEPPAAAVQSPHGGDAPRPRAREPPFGAHPLAFMMPSRSVRDRTLWAGAALRTVARRPSEPQS